jgi:tight adherence protein B
VTERDSDEEALPRLVHRLAVLLGAGLTPGSAWRHLAAVPGVAHPVVSAVAEHEALTRDPVEAIAAVSDDPPVEWRALMAAWRIAAVVGAPLSPVLRSIAEALRDRSAARREIAVALAAPRATARLVLWLPAAGVLLALLIGVDLVGTVTNPVGLASVLAGLALVHAGRRWTHRLLAAAAPPAPTAGLGYELLAVAAAGGRGPEAALQLTREHLVAVGCQLDDIEQVALEGLVALSRSAGAPLGELARAEALEARMAARTAARRTAERLGVRLMLPLGACVLPAFLLIGVVPILLGIVSSTLAG